MPAVEPEVPAFTDWPSVPILSGFFVYALFTAEQGEEPAYIGQSTNVLGRVGNHLRNPERAPLITRIAVLPCSSKAEMAKLERSLIAQYCPPWNLVSLPRDVLTERLRLRDAARLQLREASRPAPEADTPDAEEAPTAPEQESIPRVTYTIPEVAESISLSTRQVQRLVESGALPTKRIGGRRLVLVADLHQFLAAS